MMRQEATPENFAEALFGPSGKASTKAEAEWQREAGLQRGTSEREQPCPRDWRVVMGYAEY